MPYLAHTAHAQFVGFWVGAIGWILTIVSIGLVQWRIWEVTDISVITSGQAWVGIWRVCFFTHVLQTSELQIMYCQKMQLTDPFIPSEIAAAQALMLLAFILGFFGNSSIIYGLRNVYFGLEDLRFIMLAFSFGGLLLITGGVTSFIPLIWNLNSVVTNKTINFPTSFYMPLAPDEQYVGPGIAVGIFASILLMLSGVVFLSYRLPESLSSRIRPKDTHFRLAEAGVAVNPTQTSKQGKMSCHGIDNMAFR
ncbi:claudin-34-like [Trichomycterus rosablanca]|uniref:claudin-34-like n=1 Tax=Trichomycterus rosablanca TaxID=2290929 RepID=UPI002F3511DE